MKKTTKYKITIYSSIALMFAWIFVTVFLTDGKELYEFSNNDKLIFTGFILAELITLVVMFISLFKLLKESKGNIKQTPIKQTPPTKYEKVLRNRGILLMICSFLLAFLFMIAGIVAAPAIGSTGIVITKALLTLSYVYVALAFSLNIFLQKKYVEKLDQMKAAELQQYIVSHRECAEEVAESKLSFLKKCRKLTDIYAFTFAVFGAISSFCAGVLYHEYFVMVFYFLSVFCFLCSLSRIRFAVPSVLFEEDKTYIQEKDFPEIYALAKKAADKLNCTGKIQICFTDDFNAGIGKTGNIYSVHLGVILLNLLSQEELYNVMLHEFAHMVYEDAHSKNKENSYYYWLRSNGTPHFLSNLTTFPYLLPNTVYLLNYSLYLYAASIQIETYADQIMTTHGTAAYAASALLKTKYYDLHAWEDFNTDYECVYYPETLKNEFVTKQIHHFQEALKTRTADWNELISQEILSRSASHPTLKMRINMMGLNEFVIVESNDSDIYKKECLKSAEYIDQLLYQENVDSYDENRQKLYLEPKELVDSWIASGKPLVAEEYADIDFALRRLGKVSEANQLCERVISTFEGPASCYAHFMKGCSLLHAYDASGIDYIYHAIESNSNYIEDGLDIIGEFCCLTGREDDLQIYREKAIELSQKQKDIYSELSVLKKTDHLMPEQLPEGMLEQILSFILSSDNGEIQNIYLVRKQITEQDFTSAFILRFEEDASEEIQNKLMHKMFSYLDTCSDWQFSLFHYTEVKNIRIERIENSCVYSKQA